MKKSEYKKRMARGGQRGRLWMGLFLLTLVLVVVNLVFVNIHSSQDQIYIQRTSDLRVLSQNIAQYANRAVSGSGESFAGLRAALDEFSAAWELINEGADSHVDSGIGLRTRLAPRADDIARVAPEAETLWRGINANASLVLENRQSIENVNALAASVSSDIPQLQREYDEVVNILLDADESLAMVAAAQRQTWLSERIALNLNRIVAGGEQAATALEQFQRDISLFASNHEALLEGDPALGIARVGDGAARGLLNNISGLFSEVEQQAPGILLAAPEIFRASEAAESISADAERLLAGVTGLYEYFTDSRGQHIASPLVGYALLVLLLVLISLYGLEVIRRSRAAEKSAAEVNQRNNHAVLNLLEEISDLAEGDLTVQATVSEDFTGAIADSINYAVGQLRELVSAIIEVSLQVTASTKTSEKTVTSLREASERQTESIGAVAESVREMENNIRRVSENASKSLDVARNSVEIASGGADVVKNTIHGMDSIREQIQETSRRIKRLGESSQEIGGFVSLINDIADHTNTLSLNAAIQAAMAGEAGKGFGVVADEVHALAERSGDATRQIETLVKTIQRDINEAVSSMEQTTAEVVQGTRLAQSAGAALDDIEQVSGELAALVEEISAAARKQSQSATEITGSMETIQQITSETSAGTRATSEFIGNLRGLTDRLHSAVAGFSLASPDVVEAGAPAGKARASARPRGAAEVVAYPRQGKPRARTVDGVATA